MNLMNFQHFVNIKIFYLVSYLGTADEFVATWLHPKIKSYQWVGTVHSVVPNGRMKIEQIADINKKYAPK